MVVVEVEVAQQGVACKVGREAGHAGMWPGRQNTPGASTVTCTPQLPAARTPAVHSTHAWSPPPPCVACSCAAARTCRAPPRIRVHVEP